MVPRTFLPNTESRIYTDFLTQSSSHGTPWMNPHTSLCSSVFIYNTAKTIFPHIHSRIDGRGSEWDSSDVGSSSTPWRKAAGTFIQVEGLVRSVCVRAPSNASVILPICLNGSLEKSGDKFFQGLPPSCSGGEPRRGSGRVSEHSEMLEYSVSAYQSFNVNVF